MFVRAIKNNKSNDNMLMRKGLLKIASALFAMLISTSIYAQTSGSCGTSATWSYEGTTLTISGSGAMADYAYGEAPWNAYAGTLKDIEIEEGITSVGNNAFAGFTALRSVTFPSNGFTRIGDYAFSGCTNYKNLNMPRSMTEIGEGAFSGSTVRGATIYGGVKKIGDYAFESCSNLEGVGIYEGVEEIGESAFDGCSFKSVVIPSTVTTIGGGAFMSNDALETVYIGAGVTNIGATAFQGCTSLACVGLAGATAPILGDAVFTDYDGVTPLAIDAFYVPSTTPYSVGWGGYVSDKFKTLYEGTWAYYDNNKGADDSAKGTGTWSFNVTTGALTVNGTGILNVNPWMGNSAINPEWYDNEHPGFWGNVLSFVVGEGITHIQSMCVGMQINCASVTLPSTLKYVGYSCLEECAFTSIVLPEGLDSIDDYTFYGSKLTSLTIPSTVTYVGNSAFLDNEDLKTVVLLGTTPPKMGEYEPSFGDGSNLTTVYVPEASLAAYKAADGWSTYAAKMEGGTPAPATTTTFTYTASEKVTKFDTYANFTGATDVKSHEFADGAGTVIYNGTVTGLGLRALNSTKLTGITIPESVTSIGDRAFSDCSTLAAITFAGTSAVTSIGEYAFAGCKVLTSFSMPAGVATIGGGAFQGCSELASITIPESVTIISDYTFNNCKKLATVTFSGTPEVSIIGLRAFYSCEALTSIAIPASVDSIKGNAFESCKMLASVTFPETSVLTTLGTGVFQDCGALKSITLPESLKTIGEIQKVSEETYYNNSLFWGAGLTSFVLPKNVVNIYGGGMFANCPMTSLTVAAENDKFYSKEGANAIFEKNTDKLLIGCVSTVVPDGTKVIGREAFFAEQSPFTVTLPESVTVIENRAFHLASGLTSINIPAGVSEITAETFMGCSFQNLIIPDAVKTIGEMAFAMCIKLKTVSLGAGVDSIADMAFVFCPEMTDVYCSANPSNLIWDGSGFADNKVTKFHVKEADLAAWQSKFPDANVTFVGDLTDSVNQIKIGQSEADVWYSIDGRRLQIAPDTKGIYIRNGKKYIIR